MSVTIYLDGTRVAVASGVDEAFAFVLQHCGSRGLVAADFDATSTDPVSLPVRLPEAVAHLSLRWTRNLRQVAMRGSCSYK